MSDLWSKARSLRDVADDLVNQIDNDPNSGSVDPTTAQPVGSTPAAAAAPTNLSNVNAFFDQQHDRIGALAKEMNVPENYLLGLSAAESTWGKPPQGKNNLFGVTDFNTGKLMNYDSFDDAIEGFRNSQWFNRLNGKTNLDDFTNELVSTDGGKRMYNSVRPHYDSYIRSVINTVDRRLPIWEQSR